MTSGHLSTSLHLTMKILSDSSSWSRKMPSNTESATILICKREPWYWIGGLLIRILHTRSCEPFILAYRPQAPRSRVPLIFRKRDNGDRIPRVKVWIYLHPKPVVSSTVSENQTNDDAALTEQRLLHTQVLLAPLLPTAVSVSQPECRILAARRPKPNERLGSSDECASHPSVCRSSSGEM
ncbi:hypothetical protein BGY98DRAFT_557370 [Russula aff. rugulosa BPL654]|nr:hypothetical protein BGY98DRAFT_557370 [Russula aff. rugulosa BPL654]